jgi:arginyl-tRNA synthetase
VYHELEARVRGKIANFIRHRYQVEAVIATERPPKLEMGELASPVCFELAKRMKRAPRQIAQEIAGEIGPIQGVEKIEVAGAGYLNIFFDRAAFFQAVFRAGFDAAKAAAEDAVRKPAKAEAPKPDAPKTIVEHTNINPNKAAHIGHLRNAILGDTFVKLLKHSGERVEVQNYIDNTGVQVGDVVLGFMHLEKKSPAEVKALSEKPQFDYYCWDLYARVTHFLEEDKTRMSLRGQTLKAIEEGHGAEAEIGHIVSDAIVHCHLRTMERLGITYDVLPRESEILALKFWETAFTQLKERGAIHLSTAGKTAGCWVMRLGDASEAVEGAEEAANDDAKIIVRSNGTVTYVGKDIAYQMWKFGLLGLDFRYKHFDTAPDGEWIWTTTADKGDADAPEFGRAHRVYNVIDARQSYLQNIVFAGLRALGFNEQAERSTHFSYEVVALTPRCAQEMGYEITAEDAKRNYVEVSGRKGHGVKADDLIDKLEAAARAEVDQRHPDLPESDRRTIAETIAIGALRYFMVRFARNTIIAFDFKDALSFEGETGPYCQYAAVRIQGIWRKEMERHIGKDDAAPGSAPLFYAGVSMNEAGLSELNDYLKQGGAEDVWEMLLLAGSLGARVDAALKSQEPAFVAKYCFELAQAFNNFYHKHHILSEPDPKRKAFLLVLCKVVGFQLGSAMALLGIGIPQRM